MSRPHRPGIRAVAAHEVRAGDILVGDAISPTRYGAGTLVLAVERFDGWVLCWTERGDVEHDADHTVYVADRGRARLVESWQVRVGDLVTDVHHPDGPFHRVLRVNATSLILHACPHGLCDCAPGQPREVRLARRRATDTMLVRIVGQ